MDDRHASRRTGCLVLTVYFICIFIMAGCVLAPVLKGLFADVY